MKHTVKIIHITLT